MYVYIIEEDEYDDYLESVKNDVDDMVDSDGWYREMDEYYWITRIFNDEIKDSVDNYEEIYIYDNDFTRDNLNEIKNMTEKFNDPVFIFEDSPDDKYYPKEFWKWYEERIEDRVYQTIYKIRKTTKTKEKESLLKELYEIDYLVSIVFYYIINPFFKFGITKIDDELYNRPEFKELREKRYEVNTFGEFLSEFLGLMNEFRKNTYTGHKRTFIMTKFYYIFDDNMLYVYFMDSMLNKDLKLNINVKLHNKVIKKLIKENKNNDIYKELIIPESFCMLAEDSKEGTKHIKYDKRYIIEPKLDGVRVVTIIDEDEIKMISRNGRRYEKFEEYFKPYLEKFQELIKKGLINPFVLDGEMLTTKHEFVDVVGLGHSKHIEDMELKYHLFDFIFMEDYNSDDKNKKKKQFQRRNDLINLPLLLNKHKILDYKEFEKYFEILPDFIEDGSIIIKDKQHLDELHDYILEEYNKRYGVYPEGIMIKQFEGFYERKRNKTWLKYKRMKTIDLQIIKVEEGNGKYKGVMGNLICSDKDNNIVKVGSGFSDEDRKWFWDRRDWVEGSICEVKYQEVSRDKKGNLSLRFPVFVRLRDDKRIPDSISDVEGV